MDKNNPRKFSHFGYVMDDIRQLFDFHPKIKTEVEDYGNKLFKSDTSHKMCVHIRRTDFIKHPSIRETTKEFLIPAMRAVREYILQKYSLQNISLIFFTDDEEFVDSLEFPKDDYFKVYRPQLPSRGAVLHFASKYCDSLIISAGSSTFAAWMGLLMSKEKDIFYNRLSSKKYKYNEVPLVPNERLPKYWKMLELDEDNKIVFVINPLE